MTLPAKRRTLAERIGEALADHRGTKARRELAREMDTAPATLFEVEHGKANLTLSRLERLAEGYGVELDVVVRPIEEARP